MMSWYTSTNPKSFFTYSVLCKKILSDNEEENIIGDITLFDDKMRKTVCGQHESAQEFKTEKGIIQALKEALDVQLTEEELNGISSERRLD